MEGLLHDLEAAPTPSLVAIEPVGA
jgi:hypothetical protein